MSSTLPNIIENMIHYTMDDTNTLLLGKIVNYYPQTQRADVIPIQMLRVRDEWVNPSQILDCPVLFSNTSDFYIRNPYKTGDIVVLGFNKYSIDNAIVDGEIRQPEHERTFELSDCFVMGGMALNNQEYLDSENGADLVIKCKNNSTMIRITPNGELFISETSEITVVNNGNLSITNKGNTTVQSDGKVEVTCSDSISMKSATMIDLTAPQIGLNGAITMKSNGTKGATTATLEGALNVSESVTAQSDVIGGGVSLKGHNHIGNMDKPTSPPIGGGLYLSNDSTSESLTAKEELALCREMINRLMNKMNELEQKVNNDVEL